MAIEKIAVAKGMTFTFDYLDERLTGTISAVYYLPRHHEIVLDLVGVPGFEGSDFTFTLKNCELAPLEVQMS